VHIVANCATNLSAVDQPNWSSHGVTDTEPNSHANRGTICRALGTPHRCSNRNPDRGSDTQPNSPANRGTICRALGTPDRCPNGNPNRGSDSLPDGRSDNVANVGTKHEPEQRPVDDANSPADCKAVGSAHRWPDHGTHRSAHFANRSAVGSTDWRADGFSDSRPELPRHQRVGYRHRRGSRNR
jgi:hypothetical protein